MMTLKSGKPIRLGALLLLCALLMAALFVPARAVSVSDFSDVGAGEWYYDAVSYAVDRGLFLGTTESTFEPWTYMTRGMFITVLGRYAGVNPEYWCDGTVNNYFVTMVSSPGADRNLLATLHLGDEVKILEKSDGWYKVRYGSITGYIGDAHVSPVYHEFEDVNYSDYYAGYVTWGYEMGIVNGRDYTYFDPDDYITREEICCLLNRYIYYARVQLAQDEGNVAFTDADDISSWAKTDVSAMQAYGIVKGEEDGSGYKFRPGSNATRAEVAVMFQRLSQAPEATATPKPTRTPQPVETPDPSVTPSPEEITDTPVAILDSTISVPSDTIRVGIYMSTRSLSSSVDSVNLYNIYGDTFDYGTFDSSRNFVSAGTIEDDDITITTDGSTFTVKNSSGKVLYSCSGNLAIHPNSSEKALTHVNWDCRYYGDFELRQAYDRPGYITLINYVNIEDYVKGVIPYEYANSWPEESLKAAAVAIRSYAVSAQWGTYSDFGFDITNTTQVYKGCGNTGYASGYFKTTNSAVDETAGLYLTYSTGNGREICTTYYCSSSGGATEDSAHIWGGELSYLQGRIDPFEAAASHLASNYSYSITCERTGAVLEEMSDDLGLDTIAKDGIQIETYSDTGNVKKITVTDVNGDTAVISQNSSYDRWDFLSGFGFTVYSYRYEVTYDRASDSFTCTRSGWGHNVGLSQWGAYAMAKYYNKDYQDILGFYYSGTSLQYGAY